MSHPMFHDSSMQDCIQACLECHSVCLQTIQHCLERGGKHARLEHIRLLTNCAEICQTSANFMLSGSVLHARTCEVCAIVCEACEKSCREMEDGEQMRFCAEACRRCAASCRGLSGVTAVAA